jgi:hypothetical protein
LSSGPIPVQTSKFGVNLKHIGTMFPLSGPPIFSRAQLVRPLGLTSGNS